MSNLEEQELREAVNRASGLLREREKTLPNQLGRTTIVASNALQQVLDARWDEPCTSVVTIGTPAIIQAAPIGTARTQAVVAESFAVVEWGIGGATHRAEVDIGRGQSFVLTADAVRVWIDPDSSGPAGVAPLKVTATIARCAGGAPQLPPIRSVAIKTAPNGTSPQQIIPAFAKRWRLAWSYTQLWAWSTNWFTDQGATLLQSLVMQATADKRAPDYSTWNDVPMGADTFDITNSLAIDMQNVRMVFELSMG